MHYSVDSGLYIPIQTNSMHPCTKEDYKRFYPPDKNAASVVEKLKKDVAFYCLDIDLLKT